MLKLHPYQVSSHIKDTLCPSSANRATVGKASGPAKPISGWARNRSGTLAQGKGMITARERGEQSCAYICTLLCGQLVLTESFTDLFYYLSFCPVQAKTLRRV